MIDSLLASLDIPTEGLADDLKFVIHLKRYSKEDILTSVEQVHSLSVQMGMPLSIDKCIVIHDGLNNHKIQYQCRSAILPDADEVADLGIMRSADNNFHDHIAVTATKERRLIGLCWRTMQSRDPSFMLRIYTKYIMPVQLYASFIKSPYQETDELEVIQRSFTKRLSGQRKCLSGERLRNFPMFSIEAQRMESDMIIVYKFIHNFMGITLDDAGLIISRNNTRGEGCAYVEIERHLSWRHHDSNLEWKRPGIYCQRKFSARLL